MNVTEKIIKGIHNGYIDREILTEEEYKPKLVINNYEKAEKVLTKNY